MARKGDRKPIDPAILADAFRCYQGGVSLRVVATRFHLAPPTLQRELVAAGFPIRTKGEQCRLEALKQHDSPLWQVTPARWHELYWGGDYPSLGTLAERMSPLAGHPVSVKHLRAVLTHHGITIRTPGEQLAIDGRQGRRSEYGNYDFHALPPEQQAAVREKLSAAKRWRRMTAAQRRRNGEVHRKRESRPCAWCAATVTRQPCYMRRVPPERTYCNHSCANRGMHWTRKHPDLPRPLILTRLRELLGNRPPTLDNVERFAPECGADEREIDAILLGEL